MCRSPVPEHILRWRKRTGADRHDEMWEGVLHMGVMPTKGHENFRFDLQTCLRRHWAKRCKGQVCSMNLCGPGGWPGNYRIPDLNLWTPDRDRMDKETHFEGPPLVVVEIRSPEDESYEKLPFYARLGVPEVWIIDRDSKAIDLYLLRDNGYEKMPASVEGWFLSDATEIEMRAGGEGKLAIRIHGEAATAETLPAV